ncbi:MAG: dihydroorotase [Alphaproteobacteria bacterium]|nr:dihydroorotase [Alphaproteobacteria bacterium]
MTKDFYDVLVHSGKIVTTTGVQESDILIKNGKIIGFDKRIGQPIKEISAKNLHILPGVIDTQVHFREPGFEYKEDIHSGSAAAILGGVTCFFDMPNTKPNTLFKENFEDKLNRAQGRSWCDYAFFIGAAESNLDQLNTLEQLPGCAGIKVFMGSSTGDLLIPTDDLLYEVLKNGKRRVAIHAEDEPRLRTRRAIVEDKADILLHPQWRDVEVALKATQRVVHLAQITKRPIHILHVTTAEEINFLKDYKYIATVEVTPQHLTLSSPDCYNKLGSKAQMNPPIREKYHQDVLWEGIRKNIVDVIGSDHAPHTLEEKNKPYPQSPSGMPGVQTLLPLMLNHYAEGRLTLERLVDLTSTSPARIYSIQAKGKIEIDYDADLVLVDLQAEKTIEANKMASKCKWTPFEGMKIKGWPMMTILRGHLAMQDDNIIGTPIGKVAKFL